MCGLSWANGSKWDETMGAGQQMAVMEVMLSNLIDSVHPPLTNTTGGTSTGDPAAGATRGRGNGNAIDIGIPTVGNRIGASIVTAILIVGMMWGILWVSFDWGESPTVQKPLVHYFKKWVLH